MSSSQVRLIPDSPIVGIIALGLLSLGISTYQGRVGL